MGHLLRRSWSNRGGSDPSQWELPVNQASKWLIARSGSQRREGAGGSFTISNNESRKFVFSVFVGDGGTANIGGTSGKNTLQISRTGQTITVKVQPDSGSAVTRTNTTEMPPERWTNVYLQCVSSGVLNNQITMTYQVDFNTGTQILATGDFLGNLFATNGKTATFNELAGWAWFADKKNGFFGWGSSSTIPIEDSKYREAVTNNATWDVDNGDVEHTWALPDGVRFMRAWLFQAGGGSGGDGADGRDGADGSNYPQPNGCGYGSWGEDGGTGGYGGNDGEAGESGGKGSPGSSPSVQYESGEMGTQVPVSCSGGAGGKGGTGGAGGKGGRGVMIQLVTTQKTVVMKAGTKGKVGSYGGGRGGDGGHSYFGDINTVAAMPYSNGRSPDKLTYGKTTFTHMVGGSDQNGGVVFYYQW